MYKLALLTAIALFGCGCSKTDPSYMTKEEGRKLSESLTSCIDSANKLTDKVNNHEARLLTLESQASVPAGNLAGVTYVLNPQAPASPPPVTPASFVTPPPPANPALTASTPTPSGAPASLPACDLAVKFGEEFKAFQATTETRLAALDATQNKQGEEIGKHSTSLEKLSGEVKQLTEKVDRLHQGAAQPAQAAPSPDPSTPPIAEAPISNPT